MEFFSPRVPPPPQSHGNQKKIYYCSEVKIMILMSLEHDDSYFDKQLVSHLQRSDKISQTDQFWCKRIEIACPIRYLKRSKHEPYWASLKDKL